MQLADERHQPDEPCLLDRPLAGALMMSAIPASLAREYLSLLCRQLCQDADAFVVHLVDFLAAEAALRLFTEEASAFTFRSAKLPSGKNVFLSGHVALYLLAECCPPVPT